MKQNDDVSHQKLPIESSTDLNGIILALILVIVAVIYFLWKRTKSSQRDFLMLGLCDTGKTSLFTQIVYSKQSETFTSIKENIGEYVCGRSSYRIIDIPGHERIRGKFFEQYKPTAKGLIYVIDSSTVQKEIRDVADYLYTILLDSAVSSVPVLILCNKQDETMAKSAVAIKTLLEKEMNLLRTSRGNQLQSTDNAKGSNTFLGKPDKDFEFSQLSQNIQVLEASAAKKELNHLKDWIDRVV